ncbi:MAG: diguanylate cyclase [Chitinivibrionales bacterium]|nr:diguanylate cyclase [Chitinivibrionales bacterium]
MDPRFPILIADDDPVTRKLLEKTLTKEGHQVVCARNGSEALELFTEIFFPIVLTDWMMPEMNGLDLCRAIRGTKTPGYVFVVLLTAKDSKDDIITGLEAGADDYLTKPFNYAELIARIKTGIRILELERSLKIAYEEIRILSITDPLTGCYNRGYLIKHLPKELMRARRHGRPLSIILCDIDHFKEVNDTYGHHAGDEVLKAFVKCLKAQGQENGNWISRYGGEEFLIVLPDANTNRAAFLAEQFRTNLAKVVVRVNQKPVKITASFGVTGFGPDTNPELISAGTLINKADAHLYEAKQAGRNQTSAGDL